VTDIDLIKMAQAHLQALQQANSPWVGEHSLRVASGALRFLLVEDYLWRAWRASGIGGPIQVEAYCFVSIPGSDAVGFCGGGEVLPGVPFSMGWGDVRLQVKSLNLRAFLNEPCICAKGHRVTRHELVKYISNTKGGTHYDPQGRSPKSQNATFSLLRELEESDFAGLSIKTNNRNLVHHELFSIAQSLLRSEQVRQLLAVAA